MLKKVLIVDDDPGILTYVGSILRSHGFEVVSAVDGTDALQKVDCEQPDCIILDVMLPDIDGYQMCDQLRDQDSHAQIPIILLTSKSNEFEQKVKDISNIEYIQKPVYARRLIDTIENLLMSSK